MFVAGAREAGVLVTKGLEACTLGIRVVIDATVGSGDDRVTFLRLFENKEGNTRTPLGI